MGGARTSWRGPFGIAALMAAVAVASCAPRDSGGTPAPTPTGGGHGAAVEPVVSPSADPLKQSPVAVSITEASYGELMIETTPGAKCRAKVELPSGATVLAADFLTDHVADTRGRTTWSYRTPIAGAGEGTGHYTVSCTAGTQSQATERDFQVH